MKHYKNLMSALGDAMPMCLAWRLAGTEDNYFNARDVFTFALSDDEENKLNEGQFYVVSPEGAIGITSGYEYLTRWLFIPLDGEVYDGEVARLKEELEYDSRSQSVPQQPIQPQQITPPVAPQIQPMTPPPVAPQMQPMTPPPVAPQPAPQQPVPPQPVMQQGMPQQPVMPQNTPPQGQKKFCIQCGFQLNANSKFCPRCGTPTSR